MILVNPWLVEAEADEPPPAAIRRHYRAGCSACDGWKRLLSGAVDFASSRRAEYSAGEPGRRWPESGAALAAGRLRAWLILAEGDATAIAAEDRAQITGLSGSWPAILNGSTRTPTPLPAPATRRALVEAVLAALDRLGAQAS